MLRGCCEGRNRLETAYRCQYQDGQENAAELPGAHERNSDKQHRPGASIDQNIAEEFTESAGEGHARLQAYQLLV